MFMPIIPQSSDSSDSQRRRSLNLKLKRVVRTPHSEEIAIFDNNTRDENNDAVSIGKLEVHYLSDQIVGTLLIWQEFAQGYSAAHGSESTIDDVIDAVLSEVSEALGVSPEYGIEVYYPSVTNQGFVSNYAGDDSDEDEDDEYEAADDEGEDNEYEDEEAAPVEDAGESGKDDDYYRKLTRREQ